MQWLRLVSEDSGIQRLKTENRLPATTHGIAPVSPYPATHSASIGDGTATSLPPTKDRRKGDRRKGGDRRSQQVPVFLDTRSKHDRRGIENRRQTEATHRQRRAARARINLYV